MRLGGKTPDGRFCNAFKFRDGRISSLHIYLDPDYAGEDEARFRWGKNRQRRVMTIHRAIFRGLVKNRGGDLCLIAYRTY